MKRQLLGGLIVVLLTIILFTSIPMHFSSVAYGDTTKRSSFGESTVPYPPIVGSNETGYSLMVNGSYQAYFKDNSRTSNSMMFKTKGYNFSIDISTSQLHWYNSTYNAIIGMVSPMNPQNTIITTSGNTITYNGAWLNTNLQYQALPKMLKETLVISAVSAPSSAIIPDYLEYAMNLYYNNNLTIYANGIGYLHPSNQKFTTSGTVNFNDGSNSTICYLPSPYVSDSASKQSMGIYAVTANNGILVINIRIPKVFIDSAVFPVYLDPSFGDTGALVDWQGITNIVSGQTFTLIETTSGTITANNMTAYLGFEATAGTAKCAIYKASDYSFISATGEQSYNAWQETAKTFTFASPPTLTNNTAYLLVAWSGTANAKLGVHSGTGPEISDNTTAYGTFPSTFTVWDTWAGYNAIISCNYTVTAGGGDSTAPTYSSLSSSTTVAGASCRFNSTWTDETGLATTGGFIVGHNNTGTFTNATWTAFTSNPNTTSTTVTLNSTVGNKVQWQVWANDTSNNWNNTGLQTITLTDGTNPTFGSITGNTTIAGAGVTYSCTISDNAAVSGFIASWNNTGAWVNGTWTSGGAGSLIGTHNATVGNKISVIFYANDTSNNWAASSTSTFTLTDGTVPVIGAITANGVVAGTTAQLNFSITDNIAVSKYILSWNNTGSWMNSTATSWSSNPTSWSGTWNTTSSLVISVKVYANDTSNNWGTSSQYNFTLTATSTYIVTLTPEATSVPINTVVVIHITVKNLYGVSISNYYLNITKDGILYKENFTQPYFGETDLSPTGHIYSVQSVYDGDTSTSYTPTVTTASVVWTAEGGGGVTSPTTPPTNDTQPTNGTAPWSPFEGVTLPVPKQEDLANFMVIEIISVVVVVSIASVQTTHKRKIKKDQHTKLHELPRR